MESEETPATPEVSATPDFEVLYAHAEKLGKLVEGTLERAMERGLHSAEDLGGKIDHLRKRLELALDRAHAKLSQDPPEA